jgi:hypothetical protein
VQCPTRGDDHRPDGSSQTIRRRRISSGVGPLFNDRLIAEINRETTRVDLVAYRLTVESVADALIAKFRSGVPVRFIVSRNNT